MDPYTLFFLIVLIFSIIIHEVSHGYMAEVLGDPTARLQGRLTLNPIPHIDIMGSIVIPAVLVLTHAPFMFGWAKPVPYNPYNLKNQRWGEAMVAGSGPGVNIILALGFGLFIRFFGTHVPAAFVEFASIIVFVNIMLAVFNLIPIPPLDGSKLLRSVLPFRAGMAYDRLEAFMNQGGLLMVLVLFWVLLSFIGPYLGMALSLLFQAITGISF
jgi:Zn-dependent protease